MMDAGTDRGVAEVPVSRALELFMFRYSVAACIVGVMAVLSFIGAVLSWEFTFHHGMYVMAGGLVLSPLALGGGIAGNLRLAVAISVVMAAGCAVLQVGVFWEFVRTGGAEGPRGEGSPLAIIIAMGFFAAVFLCPWLLAVARGVRLWNQRRSDIAQGRCPLRSHERGRS